MFSPRGVSVPGHYFDLGDMQAAHSSMTDVISKDALLSNDTMPAKPY